MANQMYWIEVGQLLINLALVSAIRFTQTQGVEFIGHDGKVILISQGGEYATRKEIRDYMERIINEP